MTTDTSAVPRSDRPIAPALRRSRIGLPMFAGALTVALAIVAASCGSDASPPAASPDGPGAALYADNCASCHGADLRGTDEGPSHLSIVYEPNHHGDDSFRSAIENGAQQHHWTFGDMEPISGLDDAEIEAVIAYVRSEQERQGFEG